MTPNKQQQTQLTTRQIDYLEVENHCCLCGTELEFQHQLDEMALVIKEKAKCPKCQIALKEKEHIIH